MAWSPRGACVSALAIGLLSWPADARAEGSCESQLREAQELKYAGRLLSARPLALACAGSDACEAQNRQECRQLLTELRAQIPSLVFNILDEAGDETNDVALYIDGRLQTERLPNTPLEIDPGPHELRVERPNGSSQTVRLVLAPGQQLRRIGLSWAVVSGSPPPPRRAPPAPGTARAQSSGAPRWLTLSLGSLALASAGSFAYFAGEGRARERALQSDCAPGCEAGPVRDMRRLYLAADLSWVVSLLAGGAATWSYFSEAR